MRLATPNWETEFHEMAAVASPSEIPICLIWEGTKDGVFLRAVDTSVKRVQDHLTSFECDHHNPTIRVEVNLTNHLFGQSMFMKYKNVNLPDA